MQLRLTVPPSVSSGASIGVFSPSSDAAHRLPTRLERGLASLQHQGYKVKRGLTLSKSTAGQAGSPRDRAQDLNEFIHDPEVECIVASIGGTSTHTILPYVDFEGLTATPKWICGYSDITELLWSVIFESGLAAIYGPTILTEFAEYPTPPIYSSSSFTASLEGKSQVITPLSTMLGERNPWGTPSDLRPRFPMPAPPPIVAQEGEVRAEVMGGCIEVLAARALRGELPPTPGCILLLESARDAFEEALLVDIHIVMKSLSRSGPLGGVAVGVKPWRHELIQQVMEAISQHIPPSTPLGIGLPVGHVTPIASIPLGIMATFRADAETGLALRVGTAGTVETNQSVDRD